MFQRLSKSLPEALHFFRKNDPNEKEAQWFKPDKIFGGEHSCYQEEKGIDGIGYKFICVSYSTRGKAKREQIKNQWNPFLIDVRERHPVLAIAGKYEE